MTDLGDYSSGTFSGANAINDAGVIVGIANGAGGTDAMSYSGGVMTDLGHWGLSNGANAINSGGDIVGDGSVAYIYSGGVLTNLNTLLDSSGAGWSLKNATGIHDNGQIVGYGTIGGHTHAFCANPIPEPSACAIPPRRIGSSGLGLPGVSAFLTRI